MGEVFDYSKLFFLMYLEDWDGLMEIDGIYLSKGELTMGSTYIQSIHVHLADGKNLGVLVLNDDGTVQKFVSGEFFNKEKFCDRLSELIRKSGAVEREDED